MKVLFILVSILPCALAAAEPTPWEGKVTAVLEGDVIEITGPEGPVLIRLEGIDCPEAGQEYAKIAKRFTSQSALREAVRVDETGREDAGPHGVLRIARVTLSKGRGLAEELVRSGMAWWDRIRYPDHASLADLEKQARERFAGIWGEAEPMAPWDFRNRQAPSASEGATGVPVDPSTGAATEMLPIIAPRQESLRRPAAVDPELASIP